MIYARIGAIAYALWSILHIVLGVTRLSERAADGTLAEATGRLAQGHWTLLYLGVFGLILSWFNWKNSKVAFWVAALVISAEDIGFLLFPVWQGGTGLPAAAIGPGLWVAGLICTTTAYNSAERTT
ncbi:MAG: hypothetical protein AAFV54_11545 [Pseudomonadota bacterium]